MNARTIIACSFIGGLVLCALLAGGMALQAGPMGQSVPQKYFLDVLVIYSTPLGLIVGSIFGKASGPKRVLPEQRIMGIAIAAIWNAAPLAVGLYGVISPDPGLLKVVVDGFSAASIPVNVVLSTMLAFFFPSALKESA